MSKRTKEREVLDMTVRELAEVMERIKRHTLERGSDLRLIKNYQDNERYVQQKMDVLRGQNHNLRRDIYSLEQCMKKAKHEFISRVLSALPENPRSEDVMRAVIDGYES